MKKVLMKKISLGKLTGEHIGKPFAEMPCHKLLDAVYNKALKLDLPTSIAHLDLDNGSEYFVTEPKRTMAYMMRLFRSVGVGVPVDRLRLLDLVVAKQVGSHIFPGIYVGRRKIITSTHQEGVVLAPLGKFNRPIMARRVL